MNPPTKDSAEPQLSSVQTASTVTLLVRAARLIVEVVQQGRALDDALQRANPPPPQRAALQALGFGTLRWYPRLARWIELLAARPVEGTHPDIHALIAVSLHQLNFSRHPVHAICHAAVEAARVLGQPRACGFVNAVLRGFLRERDALRQRAVQETVGRFAHPRWLIDQVRADWPQQWRAILAANNEPPPMWLRVNRLRGTVADYLARLAARGIGATAVSGVPDGILLSQPVEVAQLPEFESGRVSVQDAAAQLAVDFLEAKPGMRVLDACAAPGGKACHILEREPRLAQLTLVDRAPERLERVEENLARLGLRAALNRAGGTLQVVAGDAGRPTEWWRPEPGAAGFHRILLDVPCSATGVIRRHPDIKLLRRPADIPALAAEQLRLLKGVWTLLESGGRLLYVSCSVLDAENGAMIGAFLGTESTARERGLPEGAHAIKRPKEGPGLQVLPGTAGMDGFYYAYLEKH